MQQTDDVSAVQTAAAAAVLVSMEMVLYIALMTLVVTATVGTSERLTTTSLRLVFLLHLIDVTARTCCTALQSPTFYSQFTHLSASVCVVKQTSINNCYL